MNKKNIYTIAICLFVVAIIFILLRSKTRESEPVSYKLKERKGALAESAEYIRTRASAAKLAMAIRENNDDVKSMLALAALYIQEARVTGDYMYYDMAAMQQVNNVLNKDEKNFEALTYKALIYLSQHHFADGLALAEKAKSINPYNAFIYGILVDANVEMGDYKKAVEYSDSMVSIRPDMRSYSRISYLREIHGDYPGAIEAMKLALDAGMPGDEGTEWVRVQLGHLYEKTGDLKNAEMHYRIALEERPNYAYALAGLGNIAAANKDYAKAISYLSKADSFVTDYAFKDELVDIYRLSGQSDKAASLAQIVIDEMSKDSKAGLTNNNIGHYADRELTYAYLKVNDNDKALTHALAEYNRRPKNIDVNETVAWVYYNQNKADKAIPYLQEALKTNCKNPVLLNRAGLIYAKAGDKEKAKAFLQAALKNNPAIAEDLKYKNLQTLKSL
jgi:tetratricopeptide (TPR) repeat protein